MIIVPFLPAHLRDFEPQEWQSEVIKHLEDPNYADLLAASGPAYTGIINGRALVCSGVVPVTEWRAHAWLILSRYVDSKSLWPVTRGVREFLHNTKYRRIETNVRHDFENGHRWARALGFKNETPDGMPHYGADGTTQSLYARIK